MTRFRHLIAVVVWAMLGVATAAPAADDSPEERQLRTEATEQHELARLLAPGPNAAEAYAKADEAYKAYFAQHVDSPHCAEMHYAYGEFLYKIKRYEDAYAQYMKVVSIDPKGKHSKFCAESAIFAADEMVKASGGVGRAPRRSTESVPLTEQESKLLAALDQYSKLFPEDPKTIKIIYKSAYLLYNKNQFKEASHRFRVVIGMNPRSKEAAQAVHMILDSFTLVEDWENLREVSKAFRDQEGLGSSKFKGEVANIYMRASFNLVEVNYEEKGDRKGAANAFMAFYEEFPESEVAERALNNALVYYQHTGDDEMAIEAARKLTSKFPDSNYYNWALTVLAISYGRLGDFAEAIRTHERICVLEPLDSSDWRAEERTRIIAESCCALVRAATDGVGVPVDADKAAAAWNKVQALGISTCQKPKSTLP